jgi:hypothetical protein
MTDNMLEDLRAYLAAAGITDITFGDEPDSPIVWTCLHEYAGRPPSKTHDGHRSERPGLQVVARASDWTTARARLQAVQDIIDGLQNVIIGGTNYLSIDSSQSAVPLGWKPSAGGRTIRLAQNYQIERAR